MNSYSGYPRRAAATAVVMAMLISAPCLAQTTAGASERRVIDIEAEIAAMREARQALAAEIRALREGVSDGHLRAIKKSMAEAPVDAIGASRTVVDLDAELSESRRNREALAQDLRALLSSLEERLPDVDAPGRDALAAEVRALQSRLAEASAVAHAASQARDQALARLQDSELSRQRQQDSLEAAGARVVEQSEALEAARSAAATARAVLESSYEGGITALRAELREARETNALALQQLGSAERELVDLKQRAESTSSTIQAFSPRMESLAEQISASRGDAAAMLETLRSAHAEQLEAMQRDSAQRSRADATRIEHLNAQRDQLQTRVADLLAELAVNESVVKTAQARDKQQQSELQSLRGELSAARAGKGTARVHLENQREQLTTRVTGLLAELAVRESVIEAAQALDDQRQSELQSLRGELSAARAGNDTARVHLENQREQLTTRVTGLLAELAVRENVIEAAQALDEQRQSELQSLRGELSAARAGKGTARVHLENQREQLTTRVTGLLAELAVRESVIEAAQALDEQRQSELQSLRGELSAARAGKDTARVHLENQREQLTTRVTGLLAELAIRESVIEAAQALDDQRQSLVAELRSAVAVSERTAQALERQIQEQRLEVSAVQAGRAEAQQRSDELRSELGTKTSEVRGLEQQAKQLRIRIQGLEGDASHEREELLARLASMNDRREQLEGRVRELSTHSGALARARAVLQQRVAELGANLAASRNSADELKAKLQLASKSAAPAPTVEPQAPAARRTHVVQPGESLSTLARRYLGNAQRWRELYDANREHISNPDVVEPGVELVIPQ